jgi:hypothetical protein
LSKMTQARKPEPLILSSSGLHCQKPCANQTIGDHCEVCKDGFFGNALNGGNCSRAFKDHRIANQLFSFLGCQCNGQATNCEPHTGDCYCTTKGVSGSHCDKCEQKYYGDPKNNSCYCMHISFDKLFFCHQLKMHFRRTRCRLYLYVQLERQ